MSCAASAKHLCHRSHRPENLPPSHQLTFPHDPWLVHGSPQQVHQRPLLVGVIDPLDLRLGVAIAIKLQFHWDSQPTPQPSRLMHANSAVDVNHLTAKVTTIHRKAGAAPCSPEVTDHAQIRQGHTGMKHALSAAQVVVVHTAASTDCPHTLPTS